MTSSQAITDYSLSPRRTRTLLLSLGLVLFASVSTELLPPALILGMSSTLDVGPAAIGVLVSVWALTIVVGTVPAVRATHTIPRKPLLIGSLLVFAAATIVVAVVPVYAVVLVARVASALSAAVSWSVVFAYVPNLVAPQRLGRAMAVVLGGGTLASVLGVPAGAALAAAGAWQWAFAGASGVLLLSALALSRTLPELAGTGGTETSGRHLDSTALPVGALLSAGALLLTGYMTLYAYIVPALGTARIGPGSASGVLLAAGVAGAVALVIGGAVSDRYPISSLLVLVATVPAGVLLITVAPHSAFPQPLASVGAALVGFGIGGLPPVFQARIARTASLRFRPLATSLFVVVLNIGIAGGSALGGGLIFTAGLSALGPAALALTAVSFVAIVALVVRRPSSIEP